MPRIPVGSWFEHMINWLLGHASWLFNALSGMLEQAVNLVLQVLVAPHPFLMIAILAALAYAASRKLSLTAFTVVAFLLIESMNLWVQLMETLSVVVVAVAVALLIGLPAGVAAGVSSKVGAAVRPVLDLMQTLPVFVYLIPAVFFFGIGIVPGVVATAVFSIPPAVRLTELGIRQVDEDLVEAVKAFGAKKSLVLREVQLPLAFPSIMAGINQVIMLALSMVVIAGLVGAGGLGSVVVQGVAQLDVASGFEGGLAVVALAIYLDRVTAATGSRLQQPRANRPRLRRRRTAKTPARGRPETATTTDTPSRELTAA